MIKARYIVAVYANGIMSVRTVVAKSDYVRMFKHCEAQYKQSQESFDSAFIAEKHYEENENERMIMKETMYTQGTTDFVFTEKIAKEAIRSTREK